MYAKILVPVTSKAEQIYKKASQKIILFTFENLITSPLINGGVIVYGDDNKIRMIY